MDPPPRYTGWYCSNCGHGAHSHITDPCCCMCGFKRAPDSKVDKRPLPRPPVKKDPPPKKGRSLLGRRPPAFAHLSDSLPHGPPHSPPQISASQLATQSSGGVIMVASLITSGFSRFPRVFRSKPTCVRLSVFSRKNPHSHRFSFVSSGSEFWRAASTTLAICPIAPAFLEKLSRGADCSVNHLANNGDALALFAGAFCCESGKFQIYEKYTHAAHRPLENE